MAKESPELRRPPVRDRRITCRELLIVGVLFLWYMGNFSVAVANSGGAKDEAVEFGREARVGGAYLSNMQSGGIYVHPWIRLAYTAEELKERIRRAAQPPSGQVGNSQPPPVSKAPRAIIGGPEPGDYLTASCADLRLVLVQLLRRANALKKREHSLFSGLTDAEKHELADTNEKLASLQAMLKARCSAPPSK
ncbi:MAG: hypothetical protein WBG50_22660 [Desulfomonilaceae bacterium]